MKRRLMKERFSLLVASLSIIISTIFLIDIFSGADDSEAVIQSDGKVIWLLLVFIIIGFFCISLIIVDALTKEKVLTLYLLETNDKTAVFIDERLKQYHFKDVKRARGLDEESFYKVLVKRSRVIKINNKADDYFRLNKWHFKIGYWTSFYSVYGTASGVLTILVIYLVLIIALLGTFLIPQDKVFFTNVCKIIILTLIYDFLLKLKTFKKYKGLIKPQDIKNANHETNLLVSKVGSELNKKISKFTDVVNIIFLLIALGLLVFASFIFKLTWRITVPFILIIMALLIERVFEKGWLYKVFMVLGLAWLFTIISLSLIY